MTDTAPKLPTPTLMLVTDRRLAGGEDALARAVSEAVEGGVNVVQLREKDLAPPDLLPLACLLRETTAGRALLLVNGALDVALEAGADGMHLPEDSPMVERPVPGFLIGRSVHSPQAARKALEEGVDYLVAGPVYKTRSHPETEPLGLAIIRELKPISLLPLIGIGGITTENAPDVMQAGASGVAVISALLGSESPQSAAAQLWMALESVGPSLSGRSAP